jgi:transcription elongation GreA/GreB family factor
MNKAAIIDKIRAVLEAELAGLAEMTAMSRDEATGGQSKAENKYDTRALEASYLAAGQGQRLLELKKLVHWAQGVDSSLRHEQVTVGSLLQTETEEGRHQWFFVAPSGGTKVDCDGRTISVISLHSPLGRALAGCRVDEAATVATPAGAVVLELIDIL